MLKSKFFFVTSLLCISSILNAFSDPILNGGVKYDVYEVDENLYESSKIAVVVGYTDKLPDKVVIPASVLGYEVVEIAEEAFLDAKMTSFRCDGKKLSIDSRAFVNCHNLKSVSFSGSVSLGNGAFNGCSNLHSVYFWGAIPDCQYQECFNWDNENEYFKGCLFVNINNDNDDNGDLYILTDYFHNFQVITAESGKLSFDETRCYLQNVATGQYLSAANSYGTQASLDDTGVLCLVWGSDSFKVLGTDLFNSKIEVDDGERYRYGAETHHFLNITDVGEVYCDQPLGIWHFVEKADGMYALTMDGERYLACDGNTNKLALSSTDDDEKSQWRIVTWLERYRNIYRYMKEATEDNPVDVTFLLDCPNFGRNDFNIKNWEGDPKRGGADSNMNVEMFNTDFDVFQTIKSKILDDDDVGYKIVDDSESYRGYYEVSVPEGLYKVKVQGFYREGADENYRVTPALELRQNGQEHLYAQFYVNDESVPLHSIFDGANQCGTVGTNTALGYIPNSQKDASAYFDKGLYDHELLVKVGDYNQVFHIGVRKDVRVPRDWTCFDNFRIYYLGSLKPKPVLATSITIDKTDLTFLEKGQYDWLHATVLPQEANNKKVTWASSDESVATVDGDGRVNPVSNGTAVITATTNDGSNLSASCTVKVIVSSESSCTSKVSTSYKDWNASGEVVYAFAPRVTTDDGRKTALAESYKATADVTGTVLEQTVTGLENGSYRVVLYANAYFTPNRGFDSNVITGQTDVVRLFANDAKKYILARIGTEIDKSGEYKLICNVTDGTLRLGMEAMKPGTNWHTIQIKTLEYISPDYFVTDIAFDKTEIFFNELGASDYLSLTVLPDFAPDKRVEWNSWNENVATFTFDENNPWVVKVTAVSSGTARISAVTRDGTYLEAKCYITVNIDPTAFVGVSAEDWNADGLASDESAPKVTTRDGRQTALAESKKSTAGVTGPVLEQTVTGLKRGTYRVVLYANAFFTPDRSFTSDITEGQMDAVRLFANNAIQYIPVHIGTSIVQHGEYELTCIVTDGTLHLGMDAVLSGTNWHTVQIKSLDYISWDYLATDIAIDKTEISFTVKGTREILTATVLPNEAFQELEWTSSDESVATIEYNKQYQGYMVTPVSNGTAVITATTCDGTNLSASCTVTVDIDPAFDFTTLVGESAKDWSAQGFASTEFAVEVTTRDGRETPVAESYSRRNVNVTGTVLEQTVTGLENGIYRVVLYANAYFTPDRGFDSDITDGQKDVVYLFANEEEKHIPVHIGTTIAQHGEYELTCHVRGDGVLRLGMAAEKPGTNWHTIQIKSLDYEEWMPFVSSITIDKSELHFTKPGELEELTVTLLPYYAYDREVKWTSSDERVAIVEDCHWNRVGVFAVSNGTAVITATTCDGSNLSASCVVTVGAEPVLDYTSFVDVSAEAWNTDALVGWAAPKVTTSDGRETALAERYQESADVTGTVLEQTVTGLDNGIYRVVLYANAYFTPDRGFDSDITDGQEDVVYLFANEERQYIPVHIGTKITQHGDYAMTCNVIDGTLRMGMVAEQPGTTWHTIQIKTLERLGNPTGIEEKTERNIVVDRYYDLSGRRLNAIRGKGLYIVNGKKMVVK